MSNDKTQKHREYMREYMRKRRQQMPNLDREYKEAALQRKLQGLLYSLPIEDLEKILADRKGGQDK